MVASSVGGLRTAVADGVSGVLIEGHDPQHYAEVLERLVARAAAARGAVGRRGAARPRVRLGRHRHGTLAVYEQAVAGSRRQQRVAS